MTDGPDTALEAVVREIQSLDVHGDRWDRVLRGTYDQLYDGQRTGRYRWDQLFKTEKTHFGTLVEINAQREFEFADGATLDYSIAGHEVDCKFSHSANWMLPPEAIGQLCLVITASDERSTFSVGVVRAQQDRLRLGANRDAKVGLSAAGKAHVVWLHQARQMTPNLLLQLSQEDCTRIMNERSGQRRVNMLFRVAQGAIVTRNVVATVAQQDDFMKRVRSNGGARSALRDEGIVILGGDYSVHRILAEELRLPIPPPGCLVSARLAPAVAGDEGVEIQGGRWRVASPEDPVVPAPRLPSTARAA